MKSRLARAWPLLLGLLAVQLGCWKQSQSTGAQAPQSQPPAPGAELLSVEPTTTPGGVFLSQGKPFCFSGSNNYYLSYKDKAMVDDVFAQAKAMGLKVLRTWAFIDRGSLDDSVPSLTRRPRRLSTTRAPSRKTACAGSTTCWPRPPKTTSR
jgi:hypothetical protein